MSTKRHLWLFPDKGMLALYKHELVGQISDGYWENAKPYDHYHFPVSLELGVSDDGAFKFIKNGGKEDMRHFKERLPIKFTGYNFGTILSVSEHIENIANRMRAYYVDGLTNLGLGEAAEYLIYDIHTRDDIIKLCEQKSWIKSRFATFLETYNDTQVTEMLKVFHEAYDQYTVKQLRKDLKAITAAFKCVLHEVCI